MTIASGVLMWVSWATQSALCRKIMHTWPLLIAVITDKFWPEWRELLWLRDCLGIAWCSGAYCYRGCHFLIGTVVVECELGCTVVVVAAVVGAAVLEAEA